MSFVRFDPPFYLFVSLVAIIALHWLVPFVRVVSFPWNLVGIAPLLAGIALNLQAETSMQPLQ